MRRFAMLTVMSMLACSGGDKTITSPTSDTPSAVPAESTVSVVTPTAPTGRSWEGNGLRVELIKDDWGGGSCHTQSGVRTFRLTNTGTVQRYSNLAAYWDDDLVCATQEKPTGKPKHWGCTEIKPGETCDYSIEINGLPNGKNGQCSLQVDDCWGPGGIRECAFVVGDAFKALTCDKICVPGEWKTKPGSQFVKESKWGECLTASTVEEKCYECRDLLHTWIEENGCDERPMKKTTVEQREKPCECVEEGPYEKCGEWNECHEHPGTGQCFQEMECTNSWDCKDPDPFEKTQECPCECQDNPTGTMSYNPNRTLTASASFEDSGDWTLRVSASSRESECTSNQPDYWKRTVRKTLECDETGNLNTSYSWAGHAAEWWRVILYRNGSIVDQSDCFRNPYN